MNCTAVRCSSGALMSPPFRSAQGRASYCPRTGTTASGRRIGSIANFPSTRAALRVVVEVRRRRRSDTRTRCWCRIGSEPRPAGSGPASVVSRDRQGAGRSPSRFVVGPLPAGRGSIRTNRIRSPSSCMRRNVPARSSHKRTAGRCFWEPRFAGGILLRMLFGISTGRYDYAATAHRVGRRIAHHIAQPGNRRTNGNSRAAANSCGSRSRSR